MAKLCFRAKFRRNRSNRSQNMLIFRFSKMAAAAILDFQNFKLSTVNGFKRVELRGHAKFWSKLVQPLPSYGDFFTFQDGGRSYLGFLNS